MDPEITSPRAIAADRALVEREHELDRIERLVDTVAGGESGLLALEGPAGIGKTALLALARDRARAAGLRLLSARAGELEHDYPFGVARQWFEPLLAGDAAPASESLLDGAAGLATAVLGANEPDVERASPAVLHGMYWLLANLASADPVLLLVDDAHWADEASLRLLNHFAPRLEGLAVGVVVACRPPELQEPAALLARLLADPAVEVLPLRPLGTEGAARLLAAELGERADLAFVHACEAATGGNPFYLRELARVIAERGLSPTAGNVNQVADLGPPSLSRAILTRISSPARMLALAIAVLAEPTELDAAATLARLDAPAAAAAADELVRAGLAADRRPLELNHPIVRVAVLSGLAAGARSEWHARAAGLLRERGAGVERVAVHLLQAEPEGDRRVVEDLRDAAGSAARRGAPDAAVSMLRRALREPPPDDARTAVLMELGRVEADVNLPEAAARFREAHRIAPDPRARGEALRQLAWRLGPDPGAHRLIADDLDEAIAELTDIDPELALALEGQRLGLAALHPDARAELGGRVERFAQLEGATPAECSLLSLVARLRMDAGRPSRDVAEAVERAIANPQALEVEGPDSLWFLHCSIALLSCERFDALDALLARELDLARARGSASGFARASTFRSRSALERGAVRAAEAEAQAALAAVGARDWIKPPAAGLLVHALVEQGRLDDAQAALDATGVGEHMGDFRTLTPLLIARGVLRRALGQPERALADLEESLARIGRHTKGTPAGMDARLLTVEILDQLGSRERAVEVAEEALAIARNWGTPGLLGQTLRARALVTGGSQMIELLEEAVDLLAASAMRLEHARALVDVGAALRRAGRRSDARGPLRDALELAEHGGGACVAQRARDELAASGIRVPRQAVGDPLTPSEQRIVDMAAAGATNPQIAQALFVTIKTVESHLGNAYRKLGVHSRRDLAPAAGR